jgi:hypothetical protein
VLGLASHGWYVYYVFEQMSEHSLNYAAFGQFWSFYLLPALGLACYALVLGARRIPLVLLAGCAALAVAGYAALVHSGGTANDMLPVYLVVALLAGLAMGGQPGGLLGSCVDRLARGRIANWRPEQTGRWVAAAAGGLVIAQLMALAGHFHPGRAIPPSADRVVGQRLVAGLRVLGGTVAIPSDPGLALIAGRPAVAHQGAAADVLRSSDQAAIGTLTRSMAHAVAARRFSAIIIELDSDLLGYPPNLTRYYHRCPQKLLAGVPRALFRQVADVHARPVSVWLPIGRGSCAKAVRALDGPAIAESSAQSRPSTPASTAATRTASSTASRPGTTARSAGGAS